MDLHNAAQVVKKFHDEHGRAPTRAEFLAMGFSCYSTRKLGFNKIIAAAGLETYHKIEPETVSLAKPPRIMWLDIETSLMKVETFGIRDQYIEHDAIIKDWHVMSFCAEVDGVTNYLDQRFSNPIEDDSMLLVAIHHLLQEIDIVYTWNGDGFDFRKLNARFVKHRMAPILSFRSIDGYKIAKNRFGFISNKLDYVAKYLGVEGKLKDRKYPGKKLWRECENGNMEAWDEMERYNKQDVAILKQVMERLDPWHSRVNFSVYSHGNLCSCGSRQFAEAGVKTTNAGKFQRKTCAQCGREFTGRANLIHPDTRKELLR
jgi:DNA polymerase elongation subunit (family B)